MDGNKRTAVATMVLFYRLNGYELGYGAEVEAMVRLLAVREDILEPRVSAEYFADVSRRVA